MTVDLDAATLNRPMTVSNIIGIGWKMFVGNIAQFSLISLQATAWMLAPLLLAIVCVWLFFSQTLLLDSFFSLLGIAIPAWLVLFFYCAAQSLGCIAGVSRLTYQQLVEAAALPVEGAAVVDDISAEALSTALRFTRSRKLSLLGSSIVRGAIVSVVNLVFILLLGICIGVMFFSAGPATPLGEPNINIGVFLIGLVLTFVCFIAFIVVSILVTVRMILSEQALAIESESGAIDSIGRSWKLLKRGVWRTLGVLFLAGLISIPISFAVSLLTQSLTTSLFNFQAALEESGPDTFPWLAFIGFYLATLISSSLANIIIVPFFKTVLTTIYFDARNRLERVEV